MNGYELTRAWFNFRYGKKNEVKPIHTELYFYVIDLWNRLGQPSEFGLPTDVTMNVLGIGSYSTYKKALDSVEKFGFIKEISESKNQHQSRVIALSKTVKATNKTLDKALVNTLDKATNESLVKSLSETPDESLDSIKEQQTTNNKQSKYHCEGEPSQPKKTKKKSEVFYWKKIIDLWFEFYKSKFNTNPTFNATAGKNLKSIISRLEKMSKEKKIEWTEDVCLRSFDKFLKNAWDDNWLRENFLITNLSSKFDSIINKPLEDKKTSTRPTFAKNE